MRTVAVTVTRTTDSFKRTRVNSTHVTDRWPDKHLEKLAVLLTKCIR